jgi:hypothetical protein
MISVRKIYTNLHLPVVYKLVNMHLCFNCGIQTSNVHLLFICRFEVEVGFNIPNITLNPSLDLAQTAITEVANAILEATRSTGLYDYCFSS